MSRRHQMGNHHGETRPDAQMGHSVGAVTSTVRKAEKKRAAKKRRQRDKQVDE